MYRCIRNMRGQDFHPIFLVKNNHFLQDAKMSNENAYHKELYQFLRVRLI